jgi:hypothetical protein
MSRRLRRRSKDLVCMRQLACCGYCGRQLCDAFEVDHLNENRRDDREENLVATCALCHAVKTRHVRMRRDWSHMRRRLGQELAAAKARWQNGAGRANLPQWLQDRVTNLDARDYAASIERMAVDLDLEHYRFRPTHGARRRSL